MCRRALVLNAGKIQSLVTIRSLGRKGISVTAGACHRPTPGGFSKYADRQFIYPVPRERPAAFVAALADEVRTRKYDAVLLSDDDTAAAVVENRDLLADHVGLPFPPHETFQVALDKYQTMEAARDAGVAHPKTLALDDLDRERVETDLSYPVVVKPRQSAGRHGVTVCDSFTDLEEAYTRVRRRHGPVLVQEYIPNGGEAGVYTLYDFDSTRRAVTVQERVRSAPAEGGSSSCRRTIADDDLLSRADEFLSALDWQGVAMVEFRIDRRDGEPKLLEVNPRLWGSLALSVAAGVDFPYLMYQLGAEGRCDDAPAYRTSVYARQLRGELVHVNTSPDRLAAAREVLRPMPGPCQFDVPSRDDPLPMVGHVAAEVLSLV